MDGDVLDFIVNSPRLARNIAGAIAMSKTEQIIEGLKRHGAIEIKSRSRKYRTFTYPRGNKRFIFVGSRAAVRVGLTVSDSAPMSEAGKQALLLASQVPPAIVVPRGGGDNAAN